MRTLEEARARLLEAIPPLESELVPVRFAAGRIARTDLLASVPLPPFDNCSMDGYALRSAETRAARGDAPVRLRVVGEAQAGHPFCGVVSDGECVRVFTGSPLPDGCDAVVMQEDVQHPGAGLIQMGERIPAWENVRLRGEDIAAGTRLVGAGERIGATALGALAGAGISEVCVGRRPVVGLVVTGSELAPPGSALAPGQIYESNSVLIADLLERLGATVIRVVHAADQLEAVCRSLREAAAGADLVVTLGGASVGDHDLVKQGIVALGGRVDFWRIAMRPGKPFFFGSCANVPILGLPGNPVSAFVTAVVLAGPALRAMQGAVRTDPPARSVVLGERVSNPEDRRHFVRVKFGEDGRVYLAGGQRSHFLSSLARAEGLVDVGSNVALEAGAPVRMIVWE